MKLFDAQITENRMKKHIKARLEAGKLAGVAAGVWIGQEKVCGVCLGQRDPEKNIPMTEDTIFRLASMTKPITGAAVMIQWEKGKIDLDAPVSRWLPEFSGRKVAEADPSGKILSTSAVEREITPRMLLTHSSGLGCRIVGNIQYNQFGPKNYKTLDKTVAAYANCVLDFQPGSTQTYSAVMGMDLLARIVELTSDMPYEEFLKQHIFEPLNMTDTGYRLTPEQAGREMALTDAADGQLKPVPISPQCGFSDFPDGYPGGGAGLFSTLEDYSRFARMYAGNGEFQGVRILKKSTVDLMAAPQLPECFEGVGPYFNWGLSMRVCSEQNAPSQPLSAGSFGWSGAYGTHFWVDRAKKLVGVYMSNLYDGGGSGAPTAFEFERDVMAGFGECE